MFDYFNTLCVCVSLKPVSFSKNSMTIAKYVNRKRVTMVCTIFLPAKRLKGQNAPILDALKVLSFLPTSMTHLYLTIDRMVSQ